MKKSQNASKTASVYRLRTEQGEEKASASARNLQASKKATPSAIWKTEPNKRKTKTVRAHPLIAAATIITILLCGAISLPRALQGAENVHLSPETTYGKTFLTMCQGEQWFIDQIETFLNTEQKSINTIQNQNDLNHITALGHHSGAAKIPEAIGELKKLKALYLSDNQITSLPGALYTLNNLEIIDLSHNLISGLIPSEINAGNFPHLKNLLLWDNQLTGPIPEAVYEIIELQNLDLSYNRLSGELSGSVGKLSGLKLLDLGANQISGEVPVALSSCGALKALLLYNNQLTGPIPDIFGALHELEILDISVNNLSGYLPANLPTSLQKLAVRDNHLSGNIPAAYGSLINLHTLDLYKNQISGNIPPQLAALTKTVKLDISGNKLENIIPDIFSGMNALEIAVISDNKLTGTIPSSLVQRQAEGTYVNIAQNYLTGEAAEAIHANLDNFIDGADTFQNRIYIEDYIQITENQEKNIYNLFVTRKASDMRELTDKEKLPPPGYKLETSISAAQTAVLLEHYQASSINELVTLRSDASGLYIRVLKTLETSYPVTFVLSIINNDGSAYSRTLFRVTSETAPKPAPFPSGGGGGGGGGGGTVILTSPEEKPEQNVSNLPEPERGGLTAPLNKTVQIISGYPDGSVRPNGQLSREEAARILFNLQAPERPFPYNGQYRDLEKQRWSASAVGHLSVLGIVRGYPDGLFRPGDPITRAELVTLLRSYYPAYELTETDQKPELSDIAGHWAQNNIRAAYLHGVISGYPDGSFRPDQPVTRAEAVTTFLNLSGRLPGPDLSNPFTDLNPDHWAYGAILEAWRGETYQPPEWIGEPEDIPQKEKKNDPETENKSEDETDTETKNGDPTDKDKEETGTEQEAITEGGVKK
jgi:Leucine-rich repeat (LRR) protein